MPAAGFPSNNTRTRSGFCAPRIRFRNDVVAKAVDVTDRSRIRATDPKKRLHVTKEEFAIGLVRFASLRANGRDSVESLESQKFFELRRRQLQRVRFAAIRHDRDAFVLNAKQAGRILILESVDRPFLLRIAHDKRVDELRIARNGIADEILADSKRNRHGLSDRRVIRRRLDPEVVRRPEGRRTPQKNNEQQDLTA